jgi:cobalt-zinc-cadmium efflux system protein
VRDRDCHELRREVERMLGERFGIEHTTLQVEPEASELLEIEPARTVHGSGSP